jgi:hypothetical protein
VPYPQNSLGIGTRSLARQIHAAASIYSQQSGRRPIVVSWDVERLPSLVSYYLAREAHDHSTADAAEAVENTTGAHLFGADTKMFRLWHPLSRFKDRPIMLIARRRYKLDYPPVLSKARPLSDIGVIRTVQSDKPTGTFFYRFFEASSDAGVLSAGNSPAAGPENGVENERR